MATIEKRGARWRVRVRKSGVDTSESFRTKGEAAAWAAQQEADISAGKLGRALDKSFGEVLLRYLGEVIESKDDARWERIRINAMMGTPAANGTKRDRDPLTHVRLPDLGPEHFAAWRDRRLRSVSAATVLREMNLLSAICNRAVKEWRWMRENPMRGVVRPEAPPPRTRRVTKEEIDLISVACGDDPDLMQARVGMAFRFAIETALRGGEICALTWLDVDLTLRIAHVRAIEKGARKTKTARTVPLSREAASIIESMPKIGNLIFAIDSASLDALFRKAKKRAMIEGLHFHDSRAEALTRLSKKLDVMQLARVSGHKDLRLLHEVYYRETAEDMARLLD